MSDKKQRKWRFNSIDVLVTLVLIGAVFIGTKILNMAPTMVEVETRIATAVVEIAGAEKALIDEIEVGDTIFLTVDNVDPATIIAKQEATPTTLLAFDEATNSYVETSTEEGVYKSLITIEAEVRENDANIYAGNTPLKVGAPVFVKGKGYSSKAYIVELETRAKGE